MARKYIANVPELNSSNNSLAIPRTLRVGSSRALLDRRIGSDTVPSGKRRRGSLNLAHARLCCASIPGTQASSKPRPQAITVSIVQAPKPAAKAARAHGTLLALALALPWCPRHTLLPPQRSTRFGHVESIKEEMSSGSGLRSGGKRLEAGE